MNLFTNELFRNSLYPCSCHYPSYDNQPASEKNAPLFVGYRAFPVARSLFHSLYVQRIFVASLGLLDSRRVQNADKKSGFLSTAGTIRRNKSDCTDNRKHPALHICLVYNLVHRDDMLRNLLSHCLSAQPDGISNFPACAK